MNEPNASQKWNWRKTAFIALGTLLAVAVVFGAGFWVGRVTASPFSPFSQFTRDARRGHGATGTIQEILEQMIIIKTRDGKMQTILLNSETRFDKGFQKISLGDLKVNDAVIVIGSPDEQGQIVARLVGLVDPGMRLRGAPPPNR